ncbi:MAG: hypothetical protein JXA11_06120 [Phycisphaerae bacterium]|nr:hypothetical protein [Phycisphaerae bacterium]
MIQKIFIVHHTHVDFGYTGDRQVVLNDLVNMIDVADDLIVKSRRRPEPERFRWVHENSWPVLEYLRRNGPRKARRMFDNIRNGRAELTALYVNPTDLFDEEQFEWSVDLAADLAKKEKLRLDTAMFSDCPGIPWSVADILAQRGVKYLSAAPDFIMSYPLETTRPFYWVGPKGGKLLVWFTEWRNCWYAEGNHKLKLQYETDAAIENTLEYLRLLESEGYPYSGLMIHHAMDNVFPNPKLMDFVAAFNQSQNDRQVTMATNHDFFEYMVKKHGGEFPVFQAAWPDWWASGNTSAAFEAACTRKAKSALRRGGALLRMKKKPVDTPLREETLEEMTMFDEHTWGHESSIREPWRLIARQQWLEKRLFAQKALERATRYERNAKALIYKPDRVVIANPFDHEITALVSIAAKDGNKPALDLVDPKGKIIPGRRLITNPKSWDSFDGYLVTLPKKTTREYKTTPTTAVVKPGGVMRNEYFQLTVNKNTGAISRLTDGAGKNPLISARPYGFAELVHEKVAGGSREKIYDIRFGSFCPDSKRPCPKFIRQAGHERNRRVILTDGPIFTSMRTRGSLPGVKFERDIRLFHDTPRIDVELKLDKAVDTNYESLYLAFPFHMNKPEVWIENAGAVYRAGVDQLPGSATDWLGVGEYVAVTDGRRTAVLVPHDCPMVQVGDIQTGKWLKTLDVNDGRVFSWLMNNLWFTNFPAYQEGLVELTWSLTVMPGKFNRKAAEQFARSCRVGLCAAGGKDISIFRPF